MKRVKALDAPQGAMAEEVAIHISPAEYRTSEEASF